MEHMELTTVRGKLLSILIGRSRKISEINARNPDFLEKNGLTPSNVCLSALRH